MNLQELMPVVSNSAGVMHLTSPYTCKQNCTYSKEVVILVKPGDDFSFTGPKFEHGAVFATSIDQLIASGTDKVRTSSQTEIGINMEGFSKKVDFTGDFSGKATLHVFNEPNNQLILMI